MENGIVKDAKKSKQHIGSDSLNLNGTINPFINFEELLKFYYFNTYHQRSIKLKASLLSQVQESELDKHLPENEFVKDIMYAFCMDLEIYGNAFLEKCGTQSDFHLHHMLGYQGRLNKHKEIFQVDSMDRALKLDGYHLRYYSPSGKYYGEPDYLTTLEQILTSYNADGYNTSFFENGARPGYAILFENSSPNEEQMTTFKEFFGSNFKGYENAHKTFVAHTGKTREGESPAKIKLEKLDAVEDMSFEKLKSVNKDEIIASHGVPPRLVGVIAASQLGGGTELIDQLRAFIEIVIKPKARIIEDFFTNIGIKHKVDVLDVSKFKDDGSLIANLVDKQIISQIEAKELLGFNNKVK